MIPVRFLCIFFSAINKYSSFNIKKFGKRRAVAQFQDIYWFTEKCQKIGMLQAYITEFLLSFPNSKKKWPLGDSVEERNQIWRGLFGCLVAKSLFV